MSYRQPFLLVGDYIFSFAYPVAFLGATFYGLASLVQVDPFTVITNRNVSVVLNIFIGICGILSLFAWMNYDKNVPIFGTTLLPNGNKTIKSNLGAQSTY
jgi:hypothetical protein